MAVYYPLKLGLQAKVYFALIFNHEFIFLYIYDISCKLTNLYIQQPDLQESGRSVEALGGEVYIYNCDITKPQNVMEMARKVRTLQSSMFSDLSYSMYY